LQASGWLISAIPVEINQLRESHKNGSGDLGTGWLPTILLAGAHASAD
jgi:hypothetical protein